ncbi:MAG: isochorismate synthase [Acidimicrobiales bacterium]
MAGDHGVLFARNRIGFGDGRGRPTPRNEALAGLAGIATDGPPTAADQPGTGPVAFGALPFLPGAPAELVVPELLVARDPDGTRWITTVTPAEDPDPDPLELLEVALAEAVAPGPGLGRARSRCGPPDLPPSGPTPWPPPPSASAPALDKVVLAREVVVTADAPIPVATVLTRLGQAFPDCFLYLVDGYCGASPELLVGRTGDVVRAQPMAGTAPRRGDPAADARLAANLLASPTYRHEHQVTIDAVHDGLLAFSSYVDYEPEPSVVALANVAHLATSVEGRLSHPPASVLELVEALHPTPAVCGRPRQAALDLIAELEGFDRGRYAGAVGWVDAAGNGQWAVGIRGADISGQRARLVGGNGIVGDSDPPTELIETRAKLQAMLNAIVRP